MRQYSWYPYPVKASNLDNYRSGLHSVWVLVFYPPLGIIIQWGTVAERFHNGGWICTCTNSKVFILPLRGLRARAWPCGPMGSQIWNSYAQTMKVCLNRFKQIYYVRKTTVMHDARCSYINILYGVVLHHNYLLPCIAFARVASSRPATVPLISDRWPVW